MKRAIRLLAVLPLAACGGNPTPSMAGAAGADVTTVANVRQELGVLAADSMMGRRTGTAGARSAARYIADRMRSIGIEPAGDDGFIQTIPLARVTTAQGRTRYVAIESQAMRDTIPAANIVNDANVVGIIRGVDPALRDEVVVVGAHYDHIGVGNPVDGDSINNGADDDASGVVAVLEIARALKAGPAPKRTVVFAAFTGEEVGGVGSRWYLANPVRPLDRTVAQMQVEMIARPDSLAGGFGKAWLTGYERSTMGDMLKNNGIPIVADPRPDQNFFRRSDNYAFARIGIPAHTLSSFNLHTDYHRPGDEVDKVDFEHMTAVIRAAVRATRLLADGARAEWVPGGRPSND
jgi:Iap family predicted aminopeptidase